jgi:YfdX protein
LANNEKEIAMPETVTRDRSATSSSDRTSTQVLADLEQQRKQANQRIRPEVEAERAQAQDQAAKTLDNEAIAAIQQTERALVAIAEDRVDEALTAIEQATGKINVLLSRNPATALLPVNLQVNVIDTAPETIDDIEILRDAAEASLDINDLPAARTLLDYLRSEIRVRTYHLPLATYPAALQEAARLLDQKRTSDAGTVLLVALNTLAVIDQVIALPLVLARQALDEAQARAQADKEAARSLLEVADHELERAMELGYTPDDKEYSTLRDEIKNLRKQLKGNEDASSLFTKLKERLASLTRRQRDKQTRAEAKKQPPKAA